MMYRTFRWWHVLLVATLVVGGLYGVSRVHSDTRTPVSENTPPPVEEEKESSVSFRRVSEHAPWGPRDAFATTIFKDKLWLMGGVRGDNPTGSSVIPYWKFEHKHDVWSLDTEGRWKKEGEAPWNGRRSMSVFSRGGELVMMGGWCPLRGYADRIWISSDGQTWHVAPTSTVPHPLREGQVVTRFNNAYWFIGGVNFERGETYNDIWTSRDGLTWEEVTEAGPFSPRYDHDLVVFDDTLWLIGGLRDGVGVGDVWKSNDGRRWVEATSSVPWETLHGHRAVSYRDRLWVVSGWNTVRDTGERHVWWTENGETWQSTTTPFSGREDHEVVIFNDKVWIVGGMNSGNRWEDDVWELSF